MTDKRRKLLFDIGERALWTAAQVAIAGLIVWTADLDGAYVALLAPLLAVAKGFVASKLGSEKTASTLPASVDPAAAPSSAPTTYGGGAGPQAPPDSPMSGVGTEYDPDAFTTGRERVVYREDVSR